MAEDIRKPTALRSLSVLVSNAKVEQLRTQFAAEKAATSGAAGNNAMSSTNTQDPTGAASTLDANAIVAPGAPVAVQAGVADNTSARQPLSSETAPMVASIPSPSNSPEPQSHSLIDRAVDPAKTPEQKAITEKIIDAIRKVYDPEIPINVYDLGLIYGIDIAEDRKVNIRMTLTAPGCPVAGMLVSEVQRQAESVDEVVSANVELVWDPPWGRNRMSEAALLELGLL